MKLTRAFARLHPGAPRAVLGIRPLLILLVLSLAAPFALFATRDLYASFKADRAHARRTTEEIARLAAARLDDHLSNLQVGLTIIARTVPDRLGDKPAELTQWLTAVVPDTPSEFLDLSLWHRDGALAASIDPRLARSVPSLAQHALFKDAIATGSLAVEAPLRSPLTGGWIALLAVPVQTGGSVVGVVAAATDLDRVPAMMETHLSLPPGAVVTVVDLQGTVVARSLDAKRWVGQRMMPPATVRQLYAERRGSSDEIQNFDGTARMMGFATVHHVPWLVFVGIPTDAALATARERLRTTAVWAALLLAFSLGAAGWFAGRLTRPLRRLALNVEAFGRGQAVPATQAQGPRELRSLHAAFADMSTALAQRTEAQRQSERLLRELTDNLPALISLVDTNESLRFANRAYEHWFGVPPEQLLGQPLHAFYGAQIYRVIRPYFARAFDGEAVLYERAMITLAGERQVSVRLVPREEAGRITGVFAMIVDITEQRRAQALQALSEERLSLAMEGSDLALFDWNLPGRSVYHSPHAALMRGEPAQETDASPAECLAWVHPEDRKALRRRLLAVIRGEVAALRSEHRVLTRTGEWRWVLSRGRVVERDAGGRALRLAGTHVDVTQRHALEEQLRLLADVDPLTGLPNRRVFQERLEMALHRARRHGRAIALLFLDIDHFKAVNDTFGHEAGDEVLKACATRLLSSVRPSDTVARLAGDEFTVILEDFGAPDTVPGILRRIVEATHHEAQFGTHAWQVRTSIGVVIARADVLRTALPDGDALLRRADAALYEAKHRGRGQYCIAQFDPSTDSPPGPAASPP